MAIQKYNGSISFDLPEDYELHREVDDDGDETVSIQGEFYLDEDLQRQSKHLCSIREGEFLQDEGDDESMLQAWVNGLSQKENVRYAVLQNSPAVFFSTIGQGMLVFNREIRMMCTSVFVEVDPSHFLILVNVTPYHEEETEKAEEAIEKVRKIIKSMMVNGKRVIEDMPDAHTLFQAVRPCFDGSKPLDVGLNLNITVNSGDTSTTYTYGGGNQEPAVTQRSLTHTTPDEALYPHYHSLKYGPAAMLGMLGAQVNATGTEYALCPLSRELNSFSEEDLSEEAQGVLQRIIQADAGNNYHLHENAKKMIPLFRVNPDVFDEKHDRECELSDGFMHRAYMMSALRSFAWTLTDWCTQQGVTPGELTYTSLEWILSFVSGHDWLNYDENYCTGLCGCADLHVYYVPDNTADADKQALLPNDERRAEVASIKESFPNYNCILSSVHSLDALRKDLEYLLPAIETLYYRLEQERDRAHPLMGNAADVLYAWCALAMAAKEPFFTEDGPMNCWFEQKTDAIQPYEITVGNISEPQEYDDDDEEPVALSEADLPDGVHLVDGNYVVVDNDWAIRLPDGWVYSTDPEVTDNRPLVSNSGEDFEENGMLSRYSDNCFTVFQKSDNNATTAQAFAILNSGADAVIARNDLHVSYNCHHDDNSTYCQYVIVTTRWASYTIQFFYTDPNLSDYKRVEKIEDILKTICLADEVPAADVREKTAHARSSSTQQNSTSLSERDDMAVDEEGRITAYYEKDKHVVLPAGIRIIGESTFSFSETLESIVIPEGVTAIEDSAFTYCSSLQSVTLPHSLEVIYDNAFSCCKNLTSIHLPDGLLEIGEHAFFSCEMLTSITIPPSVRKVANQAFHFCQALETLTVESTQVEFAASAVAGCQKLKKIDLSPSATIVGEIQYSYCSELTEFPLPDAPERIAKSAFSGCHNLFVFEVPHTVKSIDDQAFSGCSELRHIYIPESVTEFGNDVFEYLNSAQLTIHTPAGSAAEAYAQKNHITVINDMTVRPLIEATDTSDQGFDIRGTALQKYSGTQQHVVIPTGVTTIEENAFEYGTLESITIPEGVERIEAGAFSFCKNLKEIAFPDSLQYIGCNAFDCCESLQNITFGAQLEIIDNGAFNNCGVTQVHLPGQLYVIGAEAFYYCENLTDIWIDRETGRFGADIFGPETFPTVHTQKGSDAEKYCFVRHIPCDYQGFEEESRGTADICLTDGFEILGSSLVAYWGTEPEVTVPHGVTNVLSTAFSSAQFVTKVTFPDTVTMLDDNVFDGCTNLKEVHLPEGIRSIGEWAFSQCTSLESITWPGTATEVPSYVFYNCSALKKVVFSEGVTKLHASVFMSTNAQFDVHLPSSVRDMDKSFFYYDDKATLHVYANTYAHQWAKEHNAHYVVDLSPEEKARRAAEEERRRQAAAEAERKRQEQLAARRTRYTELCNAISLQNQIIAQNTGWFGAQARARKAAQEQLAVLQAQLTREFPHGKP